VEQGLCLDPTVLRLSPGGDGQGQAFLIEGQLVVAGPDGTWMPTALPATHYAGAGAAGPSTDNPDPANFLSGPEVAALGDS
jgi:hypothetical protein